MTLMRKAINDTMGIAVIPVSYMCRTNEDERSAAGRANARAMTMTMRPKKSTTSRARRPCTTAQ